MFDAQVRHTVQLFVANGALNHLDDYGKAILWIDPRVGVWKMCEFRARGLPSILHRPSMVKVGGRVIVMGLVERWKATANSDLETKVGVWCAEIQVKMNRKRELRVKVLWSEMVYSRPEWLLGRTSVAELYFNFFPVSV